MVGLVIFFLLLDPAVIAALGSRREFRRTVAGAGIKDRHQACPRVGKFVDLASGKVPVFNPLRLHHRARGCGQPLAREMIRVGPVVHLLGFEQGEFPIFLG